MADVCELIPAGLCQCGCGQPAPVITRTLAYVRGHRRRKVVVPTIPAAPALCLCGCGQFTSIATRNNTRDAMVKGQPKRYVLGHHGPQLKPATSRSGSRRPRSDADDRAFLLANIDDPDGDDGCWLWLGGVDCHGYGRSLGGIRVHRRSWQLFRGPIPAGLWILHRCDVRRCVNPAHLYPGTNDDNVADMISRRRFTHKLTDDQVRAIRAHEGPQADIAAEFGISNGHVSQIRTRRIWVDLSDRPGQ